MFNGRKNKNVTGQAINPDVVADQLMLRLRLMGGVVEEAKFHYVDDTWGRNFLMMLLVRYKERFLEVNLSYRGSYFWEVDWKMLEEELIKEYNMQESEDAEQDTERGESEGEDSDGGSLWAVAKPPSVKDIQ